MTNTTDKAMREAFEAWASDQGKWPSAVESLGGFYRLAQTQSSWLAWMAGWAEAIASSAAAPEQADRAQRMRDAGYTRRPTLRERAEPDHDTDYEQRWPNAVTPAPAAEAVSVDALMEQAQVFASAWSLVGGRFDDGSALDHANEAKAELRAMLSRPSAPLSEPTAEGVTGSETAIRIWHKHCAPFRSKLGEHPPSVVINAMMEFAALSSPASIAGRPSDDELWDQTLAERDRYHERADELAGAIAAHLGIDIGEHSNLNDPWQNALAAIASSAGVDAQRLDWLAMQVVEVRTPLVYGSRANFITSPKQDDPAFESGPSDLRQRIDAAIASKGQPQ